MISVKTSKWFRGVAIILVLLSHYAEWIGAWEKLEGLRSFICMFGIYGVSMFFFLSAYGLVKSAQSKKMDFFFILRRIVTVYIPYLLVAGVIALVDRTIKDGKDMLYYLIGHDYWFMMNLFVFYLLFFLFWKIGFGRKCFLTIGILCYSLLLYKAQYANFWIVSNGAFVIGVLFSSYEEKMIAWMKQKKSSSIQIGTGKRLTLLAFTVCLLLHILSYIQYRTTYQLGWLLVFSLSFTGITMVLYYCFPMKGKLLGCVGTYSLYVYLFHTRIYAVMFSFIGRLPYKVVIILVFIATLAVSIAVGYGYQLLINRISKRKEKVQ